MTVEGNNRIHPTNSFRWPSPLVSANRDDLKKTFQHVQPFPFLLLSFLSSSQSLLWSDSRAQARVSVVDVSLDQHRRLEDQVLDYPHHERKTDRRVSRISPSSIFCRDLR